MYGAIVLRNVRLLEDVVLDLLAIATILEHAGHAAHTTHATANRGTDLGWVHVLVKLIRVGDTRLVEGLGSAHEGPERRAVGLSDDVGRNTVTTSFPAGRDLPSDETVELDGLGHEDASALLELDEPLAFLTSPDVALVAVLVLVLLGIGLVGLERLEVVQDLDLLVEDLLLRIVPREKLGLCKVVSNKLYERPMVDSPIIRTPACLRMSAS